MDRPASAPGYEPLPDAAVDSDGPTPIETDTRQSSTTSEASPESASETLSCPWRTRQFHFQECSRYFDCPSHTIERRLSIDEHQYSSQDGHEQAANRPTSEDELYSSEAGEDLVIDRLRRMDMNSEPDRASHERATDQPTNSQPGPALSEEGGEPSTQPTEDGQGQDHHGLGHIDQTMNQDEPRGLALSTSEAGAAEDAGEPSGGPSRSPVTPVSPLSRYGAATTLPTIHGHDQEMAMPEGPSLLPPQRLHQARNRDSPDFMLPRWQPDAEATYCPICYTQFSIFVRKHHCR